MGDINCEVCVRCMLIDFGSKFWVSAALATEKSASKGILYDLSKADKGIE
jgi:hypothetical protein